MTSTAKAINLKPETDIKYATENRDDWVCYEVLHGGEGPCQLPQEIGEVWPCLASRAAEHYAEIMAEREDDEYPGDPICDGEDFYVAVQTREGYAIYFRVRLKIIRQFEANPSEVEVVP